jgi:hypothetical protein
MKKKKKEKLRQPEGSVDHVMHRMIRLSPVACSKDRDSDDDGC